MSYERTYAEDSVTIQVKDDGHNMKAVITIEYDRDKLGYDKVNMLFSELVQLIRDDMGVKLSKLG